MMPIHYMNRYSRRFFITRVQSSYAHGLSSQAADDDKPVLKFAEVFSKALLSRVWPTSRLQRSVRVLNLCGNDPESAPLYLARVAAQSSNHSKWLLDVLRSLVNKKAISEIKIPPKEIGPHVIELQKALEDVYRLRKPVVLKVTDSDDSNSSDGPSRRVVSSQKFSSVANIICEEIPLILVADIISALKMYAQESLTDVEFVSMLVKNVDLHGESLYHLFNCLSVSPDAKQKKKILISSTKKKNLAEQVQELIVDFSSTALGSDDQKRKVKRSTSSWNTRPYNTKHCLNVLLQGRAVDDSVLLDVEKLIEEGSERDKSFYSIYMFLLYYSSGSLADTEQWFHESRDPYFKHSSKKIFLRNIPLDVTIEDIRLAFLGIDPILSGQVKRPKLKASSKVTQAARNDIVTQEARNHNLQLSPVHAVHLVKEDLNSLTMRFLYELPIDHDPDVDNVVGLPDEQPQHSDSTTNSSGAVFDNRESSLKNFIAENSDIDFKATETAQNISPKKRKKDVTRNFRTLDSNRVKSALLSVS